MSGLGDYSVQLCNVGGQQQFHLVRRLMVLLVEYLH